MYPAIHKTPFLFAEGSRPREREREKESERESKDIQKNQNKKYSNATPEAGDGGLTSLSAKTHVVLIHTLPSNVRAVERMPHKVPYLKLAIASDYMHWFNNMIPHTSLEGSISLH